MLGTTRVVDRMAAASSAAQQSQANVSPSERFFRYFQHEVTAISEKFDRLSSHGTSGGERADAVDHCLASIARLSDEVRDAGSYIPAHDQRTYGEAIKTLSNRLQEIRSSFAPRPKFAFKGGSSFTAKKNESAISLNDAVTMADDRRRQRPGYGSDGSNESSFATTPIHLRSPAPEADTSAAFTDAGYDGSDFANQADLSRFRQPSFSQSASVGISNHDGMHIVLPASASRATTTGTLSNLHQCVVDMSSPTAGHAFAGLTLKDVSESLVVCGHVNGPTHLTHISRSIIVVATGQFRMHNARHCDIYLLCASRPILEGCSSIRFAPLPDAYLRDSDRSVENLWQTVDDFNWLRQEQSPNWRLLEPESRVREDVWRNVVPGGPGLGTEDVLNTVKLP